MELKKLLDLIPGDVLSELALETNVNHYAKKLQGEVVFKLLLHCILSHKDNSLRTMESAYESMAFQLLNDQQHQGQVRYSSISERLSTIKADYFEKLFRICVTNYKKMLAKKAEQIIRFDSTIVTLSSRLIEVGYQLSGGSSQLRQLKFTVGYSQIPEAVDFYHQKKYTSENVALKQSILKHHQPGGVAIHVFDRGINSRKTFDELAQNNIHFISRINAGCRYQIHKGNTLKAAVQTDTLKITSDQWIHLFTTEKTKTQSAVRCIQATRLDNNDPLWFITNLPTLTPEQITNLYKHRWDIEVFFKFLKQTLNFRHLLNRTENGIKVILYVTMIAAILLIAYKQTNQLTGFKIPKQKLAQHLEREITKHLITLCGGNPDQLDFIFPQNST